MLAVLVFWRSCLCGTCSYDLYAYVRITSVRFVFIARPCDELYLRDCFFFLVGNKTGVGQIMRLEMEEMVKL